MRSSAGGAIGSGSGSAERIADDKAAWLWPSKGRFPEINSYSTTPAAKMSVRASAGMPSNCSGAIYCGVPITVPFSVSGRVRVESDGAGFGLAR